MATNDGMVRKVGWRLVSQREKVFSCGTARSVGGASENCGACHVTLEQRGEDDGGDQGGEQEAAKNAPRKKGIPWTKLWVLTFWKWPQKCFYRKNGFPEDNIGLFNS